jgi:Spy/CpxP family protein refolding chaperone
MTYVRPRSIVLGLAALLFSAPAFGQNPPPGGRARGQGGPPPDSIEAMRARLGEMAGEMQGRGRGGPPSMDDFGRFLFPPEMVMQRQREISLTDAQKTLIVTATQKLESDVVALNWKMVDEQQKLSDLVQATSIDSTATLAQIDRVLDLERQIKRSHVAALVRIKNALTPDQQRTLRTLMGGPFFIRRIPMRGGAGGRGRGQGGGEGDGLGHGEFPPERG